MPFSSYSVASSSPVTLCYSQIYISAALLYLAELNQLPGTYKADHDQLCQGVSQIQSTFRPPHPLSCHHVRQGSQESTEERSLPQLIYCMGISELASVQHDCGLGRTAGRAGSPTFHAQT